MTSTGNRQPRVVATSDNSRLVFETGKKVFEKQATVPEMSPEKPIENGIPAVKDIPDLIESGVADLDLGSGDDLDDYSTDEELTRTIPTVFRWENGGNEVFLSGSFTDWNARIPMNSSLDEFTTIIELPEGEHQFKFFVDGTWIHDPNLPTTSDTFGGRNNVVAIQKSDFEVMEALNSDDKKPISSLTRLQPASGSYGQFIPSHNNPMVVKDSGIHSSVPPALPPHLLNVNLNKGALNVNEPSLLREPDHVSVNHLYALSIKDGVMVVSSCFRYREKYITTLLYRPVVIP